MTVNDSQEGDNFGSQLLKSKEFFSPKVLISEDKIGGKKFSAREIDRSLYWKPKACDTELETDQDSIGSSEEMESPRSVTKVGQWTPKKIAWVHSQILRIRAEDSHLGEDIVERISTKDKLSAPGHHHHHHLVSSHMDVMLFSRPASPLSGKTAVKTIH